MNPPGEPTPRRRASDHWPDERISDAIERIENQIEPLAPLPMQVAKLEVRLDRAVADISKIDIGAALRRVEDQVASLHGKLDADMEGLKETFVPRSEMPALYVPRTEHEKRVQFRLQWPSIALALVMIVSQIVLLVRGIH